MTSESTDQGIESIWRLVRDLVTSGSEQLHAGKFKALIGICKTSDECVKELYKCLIKLLKKKHAEIRFSTFQIINLIFICSHCFRCLVIKDFVLISKLIIIGVSSTPLPKPSFVSKKLSKFAIKTINEWYLKYSEGYYELEIGHEYLRICKFVNFERHAVITPNELKRIAEREEKERKIMIKKLQKIRNEMDEYDSEIRNVLCTFENCFKLIIPDVRHFHVYDDNVDIGEDDEDCTEHGSAFMQRHGFTNNTTVQINLLDINKVKTTMDNQILVNTLKDQVTLVKKNLLPKVRLWESTAMPYASIEAALMRKIIDVKYDVANIVKRYESLSFLPAIEQKKKSDPNSDSDDDFLDVPIQYNEMEMLGLSKKDLSGSSNSISEKDLLEAGPSGVQKETSKENVYINKKNTDIEQFSSNEWEPSLTVVASALDTNQIWSANEFLHDYEQIKAPSLLGVSTQIVDYQRTFEQIKWECRAPLSSGKFCPRKDKKVCPLHGPVIARNLSGNPVIAKDIVNDNLRTEEKERKNPPWQDPSLLADIKLQTGVDLDMRKIKRRKRLYDNLTLIRKNDARSRLSKKIFSRRGSKASNGLSK